jgi:hypothetical protein
MLRITENTVDGYLYRLVEVLLVMGLRLGFLFVGLITDRNQALLMAVLKSGTVCEMALFLHHEIEHEASFKLLRKRVSEAFACVFSYVALGPEWKDLPVENIGLFRRQVAGVEIAGAYALEFGPDKGANELGIYGTPTSMDVVDPV